MDKTKVKKGKSEGNPSMRKLFQNSNYFSSINTPRINITYNNIPNQNNLRIVNKRMINKRDEILSTLNENKPYTIFYKQDFPFVSSQENLNTINSPKSLGIYNIQDLEITDREGLIVELYHVTNDMDLQNQELEYLKQDYNNLLNNSMTYKILIEKILRLDENGNYVKNENNKNESNSMKRREKSKSENNFPSINNTIDEKEEYNTKVFNATSPKFKISLNKKLKKKGNNETLSVKTKHSKNRHNIKNINLNDKENKPKINVLIKQNNEYKKILSEKENKLIKIKNNPKTRKFDELIHLLNTKNNELEDLVSQSQEYQYEKFDTDNKIQFYSLRINRFIDEIYSLSEKLKINKKELQNTEKDIDALIRLKEELKQKELILYEEEKNKKNNIKTKKEREDLIEQMLKERKEFFEEREKTDAQILELKNKEDIQKKNVEKNNRIIDGLYKENDQLRKEINFYENSRIKLLEKADQPRKNRIKMKEMENEIKKLEKDIISYKVESEEKEKKMEENEEINNEEIKTQEEEITAHENIVKELTTQINSLKKELKNKKNNKKKRGEELSKIKEDLKIKKKKSKISKENMDKEKKEKELQDNNIELLKIKENEEKDKAFLKNKKELSEKLEKLKEKNSKIKEENEKLKKLHKEKMKLYKLAVEKQSKLNKILNEIKEMTDKS